MQINRIECRLGATINAGDFQSIKTEVMAQADIDRNEDPIEAYTKLAEFVRAALVKGAHEAHPDKVRLMLTKDHRMTEATAQQAAQTVQQAAPQQVSPPAQQPAAQPAQTLAQTGGMDIGGLDKEPMPAPRETPAAATADDLESLLGTGPAEVVTREELQAILVDLNKAGGKTALLEVLKTVGAQSLSQVPESQYAHAKQLAQKKTAEIKAAQQ